MNLENRISAFVELGNVILTYLKGEEHNDYSQIIDEAVFASKIQNPWFTKDNVLFSLKGLSKFLSEKNLQEWLQKYPNLKNNIKKSKIGIIMAGNIPLVGFHDMFCVLISGNVFIGKVSSKDNILLKALVKILIKIEEKFENKIIFTDSYLKNFDAVIATGSNNTSRYFESYFAKYPNIIRRNRNSIAVLNGKESNEELSKLGLDIFTYFGLGCRNVSKIFLPKNYEIENLIKQLESFKYVAEHHKYFNNYEYNKAIYLVNTVKHFDNGFMLFTENTAISSPISVIYFEYYNDINNVKNRIKQEANSIQCVVSSTEIDGEIAFGKSQLPELWDYADNVDSLDFLIKLS